MTRLEIRGFTPNDIGKVRALHNEYYPQFDFPDFLRLLVGYVVEDEEGIILAGGVECVGEAVLVTNRARNAMTIGRALLEAKRANMFTCRRVGIRDLYAFVDNDDYAKHLIQHGFVETDKGLLLRVK